MTEEEFAEWRKNKLLYGMHWRRLIDRNTAELVKYNQTAVKYINGETPQIFASGYNSVAEQIPDSPVAGFDFELINANTVNNLIHEEGITLPKKKLDPEKDKQWNAKQINAQILQGIMQGESIPKMAKRMQTVANSDLAGATRTARTMHTAAQNCGRQAGYNKAAKEGAIFVKVWLAAHDDRTRSSHAEMDGQTVAYDEMFVSPSGAELEFPGDWRAPAEEVYNCRCTMITKFQGFKKLKDAEDVPDRETPKGNKAEEYEWIGQESSQNDQTSASGQSSSADIIQQNVEDAVDKSLATLTASERQELVDLLVNNDEERELFVSYADTFNWNYDTKAYCDASNNEIHWKFTNTPERHKFGTVFHEFGHGVDYRIQLKPDELKEKEAMMKIGVLRGLVDKHNAAISDAFLTAMRNDKDAFIQYFKANKNDPNWNADVMKNPGLQDWVTGIYGYNKQARGGVMWGHDERYYNRAYDIAKTRSALYGDPFMHNVIDAYDSVGITVKNQTDLKHLMRDYDAASELWANLNEALASGTFDDMEKVCPESAAVFKDLIKRSKNP